MRQPLHPLLSPKIKVKCDVRSLNLDRHHFSECVLPPLGRLFQIATGDEVLATCPQDTRKQPRGTFTSALRTEATFGNMRPWSPQRAGHGQKQAFAMVGYFSPERSFTRASRSLPNVLRDEFQPLRSSTKRAARNALEAQLHPNPKLGAEPSDFFGAVRVSTSHLECVVRTVGHVHVLVALNVARGLRTATSSWEIVIPNSRNPCRNW
jgi:hypothetical protein